MTDNIVSNEWKPNPVRKLEGGVGQLIGGYSNKCRWQCKACGKIFAFRIAAQQCKHEKPKCRHDNIEPTADFDVFRCKDCGTTLNFKEAQS